MVPLSVLCQVLEKEGLTAVDFQRLVMQYEDDPRIRQALMATQAEQAEVLNQLGLGL